jgi:hypothetical protein
MSNETTPPTNAIRRAIEQACETGYGPRHNADHQLDALLAALKETQTLAGKLLDMATEAETKLTMRDARIVELENTIKRTEMETEREMELDAEIEAGKDW